jgi:UDP-glucose 4-epimerase
MSRVTLIGGSGLIGTGLCQSMCSIGDRVTVLDLVPPDPSVADRVEYRPFDIRSQAHVDAIEPCDRVYLLASLLGKRCTEDPVNGWATNVIGITHVVHALTRWSTPPTVCFLSSAAVYQASNGSAPITECHATAATGLYAASKLVGECLLRGAGSSAGLRSYILRPFTVYGPGPSSGFKGHFLANWMERCLDGRPLVVHGDGSQSIDLVHVSDLAALCRLADDSEFASTSAPCLNVGCGIETPLLEVARLMRQIRPAAKIEFEPGTRPTQHRNFADISLARQLLGYEPRISPGDGLRQLLGSRLGDAK